VRPVPLIRGAALGPLACVPAVAMLARTVLPVVRSCTKMSGQDGPDGVPPAQALVSSGTSAAAETNVT